MAVLEQINRAIEDVPLDFQERLKGLQSEQLTIVLQYLSQLDTVGGQITNTVSNYNLLSALKNELQLVMQTDSYVEAVEEFLGSLNQTIDLSAQYYGDELGVNPNELLSNPNLRAGNLLSQQLIADTFLGDVYRASVVDPLFQQVSEAVQSNGEVAALVAGVSVWILGDQERQTQGSLEHLAATQSSDLYSGTARGFIEGSGQETGVEFWLYTGGLIRDSRKFCVARNGKVYHTNEVKAWTNSEGQPRPSGDWQGKYKGTTENNIFRYCGGYNCKHTLAPQSLRNVPEDVLKRNFDNGNWNPTQADREVLIERRGIDWL